MDTITCPFNSLQTLEMRKRENNGENNKRTRERGQEKLRVDYKQRQRMKRRKLSKLYHTHIPPDILEHLELFCWDDQLLH